MSGCYGGKIRTTKTKPVVTVRPPGETLVYLCVYRQVLPRRKAVLQEVGEAAKSNPMIAQLLGHYESGQTVYDWGDDPSFFSAECEQGSAAYAAWGVCRPNVRRKLCPGDLVVYFCARSMVGGGGVDYLFSGYGTVKAAIFDRGELWRNPEWSAYRSHLNTLVRYDSDHQVHDEPFPPGHPDWEYRLESPYIIFDPELSRFKMRSPLLVAAAKSRDMRETWRVKDDQVEKLHSLLFGELGLSRGLRTSRTGTSHPHINLTRLVREGRLTAAWLRQRLDDFL